MTALLLPAAVVGLNAFAALLVLARAPLYRTRLYRPMLLNIGLSLAPAVVLLLVLAGLVAVAVAAPSTVLLWTVVLIGGAAWLLLLPNSAYLITELNMSHRRGTESVPLWYDIVLTLSLALSGVMNTVLNVYVVQAIYVLIAHPNTSRPLAGADSWVLAGVVLLLVTFGMYLGRYIRFNSWDIAHPASFARKLGTYFREPGHARDALGFCLTHTILLALVYLIVTGVPDALLGG
ncbi:DUF1361 domain-containing protein [Actinotalea caeni]|uniref:DUF1361 domain-containing protein n=1 Tax=Actinotalea caeni TaxID=1348467 RepID=UPI0012E1DB71|nr:DUF1361 domain-containing protein [Actinotalea caeni]